MQFLRFKLINKHGVVDHRGEVLVVPSRIESVRSFIHTDHMLGHNEVGSVVTMKSGEKHWVSQRPAEIAEMLQDVQDIDEAFEERAGSRTAPTRIYRGLGVGVV